MYHELVNCKVIWTGSGRAVVSQVNRDHLYRVRVSKAYLYTQKSRMEDGGGGRKRTDSPSPASQWPHLDDVDLRGDPVCCGRLARMVEVVAGDDEDDGGGAEGHPLLGPVPAHAGHDAGPEGPLDRSQGQLVDVALEP